MGGDRVLGEAGKISNIIKKRGTPIEQTIGILSAS